MSNFHQVPRSPATPAIQHNQQGNFLAGNAGFYQQQQQQQMQQANKLQRRQLVVSSFLLQHARKGDTVSTRMRLSLGTDLEMQNLKKKI